jgi:hypothetical protein
LPKLLRLGFWRRIRFGLRLRLLRSAGLRRLWPPGFRLDSCRRHRLVPVPLQHYRTRFALCSLSREGHTLTHDLAIIRRPIEENRHDEHDEDDEHGRANDAFFQSSIHYWQVISQAGGSIYQSCAERRSRIGPTV